MSKEQKQITLDLTPINIKDCEQVLKYYFKSNKAVFLHGPVGIGKSDLIRSLGKQLNRKVIDFRLSQVDSTDLRGIPFCPPGSDKMVWAAPSTFPTDPEDSSILFFDELNCAPPSIQAAAYQLILDRRIGDYFLPKNCLVVAAGNRDSDKGVTFKMATPLLNRFCHIELKADLNCWVEWASVEENGILPLIVEYLKNNKTDFIAELQTPQRAFATPRSWKFVSDVMKSFLEDNNLTTKDIPTMQRDRRNLLNLLISGCVGAPLATKILSFFEKQSLGLDVDRVLVGEIKSLREIYIINKKTKNIVEESDYKLELKKYINEIVAKLDAETREFEKGSKNFNAVKALREMVCNCFNFVLGSSGGNKELVMIFVQSVLRNKIPLTEAHCESYAQWCKENTKYIVELASEVKK